jgi:hypothetical protein
MINARLRMKTAAASLVLVCVAFAACGQGAPGVDDMAPAAVDLTSTGQAPEGFWAACSMSQDCAGYAVDRAPGRLGCASYLGVDHCTMPCDAQTACWAGTSCTCTNRVNVSGFPETDCYCTPQTAAP